MPNQVIQAIVVDLAVDVGTHADQRRISCSGKESVDDFLERVRKALLQMLGREPEPTRAQLEQALRDAYRDPMCVSGHVPDCDCGSPPLLRRPT